MKKEDFFSELKNKCPDDSEIERTKQVIEIFGVKNVEEKTRLYMKAGIILLADIFEKKIKISTEEYGIDRLNCVSVCSYTLQCVLKYTDIKLQTLQDKDMILLFENNIRGAISSVMVDRYVNSDESKKILCSDATNLYGHSVSQTLSVDEIKFERNFCLKDILNTPNNSDFGSFLELDARHPYKMKKTLSNLSRKKFIKKKMILMTL